VLCSNKQNPNNIINKLIYYASRLMNNVEINYATAKKETLAMIYAIKKFQHYLFGNSFIFFVGHQALLYLVTKLVVIGHIVKWLLLLQEFDFKAIYKLGWIHFVLDQLSQKNHGESTIGVEDQLPNAILFIVGID